MHLIVGLGNPGLEYKNTRHNAGFIAIDKLALVNGLGDDRLAKQKFGGLLLDGTIAGQRAILLKPMTYMNRSGASVREACQFYKIPLENILIIVDDLALPCGRLRLRVKGGAGGHNGLKDIERHLSTKDYARLRFGIDAPGKGGSPAQISQVDYVLGKFSKEEMNKVEDGLNEMVHAVDLWLNEPIDKAMSLINGKK